MANPSKAKGTAGETELLRLLEKAGVMGVRNPPNADWDLTTKGRGDYPIDVLATRPDRGQWLITLRLADFVDLLDLLNPPKLHIEVKRYKKFAHHTIFTDKFDRRKP